MVAGSYGPYGAFTTYRPPWEGFFIPPAMRVVADFQREAARMYGVTTRYVQQAKAVYEADQTLAHKVHQGEITVTAALKEIDRCHNPPKDPPPENLPNLKYREWLDGAFKALTSLEGYLRQITVYSRPPVPDEVGWAREVELKR